MTLISGPPKPELPYRFWCPCGATWNSDSPVTPTGTICVPGAGCILKPFKENP